MGTYPKSTYMYRGNPEKKRACFGNNFAIVVSMYSLKSHIFNWEGREGGGGGMAGIGGGYIGGWVKYSRIS